MVSPDVHLLLALIRIRDSWNKQRGIGMLDAKRSYISAILEASFIVQLTGARLIATRSFRSNLIDLSPYHM